MKMRMATARCCCEDGSIPTNPPCYDAYSGYNESPDGDGAWVGVESTGPDTINLIDELEDLQDGTDDINWLARPNAPNVLGVDNDGAGSYYNVRVFDDATAANAYGQRIRWLMGNGTATPRARLQFDMWARGTVSFPSFSANNFITITDRRYLQVGGEQFHGISLRRRTGSQFGETNQWFIEQRNGGTTWTITPWIATTPDAWESVEIILEYDAANTRMRVDITVEGSSTTVYYDTDNQTYAPCIAFVGVHGVGSGHVSYLGDDYARYDDWRWERIA